VGKVHKLNHRTRFVKVFFVFAQDVIFYIMQKKKRKKMKQNSYQKGKMKSGTMYLNIVEINLLCGQEMQSPIHDAVFLEEMFVAL